MEKVHLYNDESGRLYNLFLNKEYKVLKILKDDNRSKVTLIEIDNKKIVLKIPVEKNTKKWQQILSVFRGSESKREFYRYLKILNNGFKTLTPLMYYEKRNFIFINDSFIMTEYLDGKEAVLKDLEIVAEELRKIHKFGFLHGDSQLPNFLIKNNETYVIDAKFQKNIYGPIGSSYEFIYLEESCHEKIDIYNKKSLSYKIAKMGNEYFHWLGRMKKKLRGKE